MTDEKTTAQQVIDRLDRIIELLGLLPSSAPVNVAFDSTQTRIQFLDHDGLDLSDLEKRGRENQARVVGDAIRKILSENFERRPSSVVPTSSDAV